MIIVSGTIEIRPEGLEAARAAFLEVMAITRTEAGCRVYEFSQTVENPNVFRVYEEWDDLPSLGAHGKAPHMSVFREALGQAGMVSRDIGWMEAGDKTAV